jgi:hypothetical protein
VKPVIIHSQTRAGLDETMAFYEQRRAGVARFAAPVEHKSLAVDLALLGHDDVRLYGPRTPHQPTLRALDGARDRREPLCGQTP